MRGLSDERVKKTTHPEFFANPQQGELVEQQMAEFVAELSTRTPLDELLIQTSTIASFCYQLRRAAPNRRKKQDFVDLAKTITWLAECCEAASELLKEYPAFKSSVVGTPHSVGLFRRNRNWHWTILNLGGDALSRVTTPGGVCVDVRRSTKEGKIVFVADLLQKNWPAIQDQLRLLSDFDLLALREVLRDESEIVKRSPSNDGSVARILAAIAQQQQTPKLKRGGKRKYDSKLKKRVRDAWATGRYARLNDLDKPLGLAPGTAKKVHDTDRKKPRATE